MSTVGRLLQILNLFNLERPDWTVDEAAEILNMTISTTYRYFNSLTKSGMLAPLGKARYVLGPTIIKYDRLLRLTDPLIGVARPEMERICRIEPDRIVSFLCRLFGESVICVHQEAVGSPPFSVAYERGRLMPLFAGSASKVILANLPNRQLRSLYSRNCRQFSEAGLGADWGETRTILRKIRNTGYVKSTAELDRGMRGLSVALMSPTGSAIGSLSVAAPLTTLTGGLTERIIKELEFGARRIERELQRLEVSRLRTN